MAYNCRAYRILIASPSDAEEEREVIVSLIQGWNDLYSYPRQVVLLPLRWETHVAPAYGTRPQEVINRAIVDDCDLLVGVFWTRIGSPTGVADSGTLEEIERVGKAGKPIMLYFSNVAVEPDKIDSAQIERLKEFKLQTYPKGLVENYKRHEEFRDKFARQLELKLRELQKNEQLGAIPISMEIMSLEDNGNFVRELVRNFDHLNVKNFDVAPKGTRDRLRDIANSIVKEDSYFPVALTLKNSGQVGLRNVYIQIEIAPTIDGVDIALKPETGVLREFSHNFGHSYFVGTTIGSKTIALKTRASETIAKVMGKISIFETDKIHKSGNVWNLTVEWDALQAQRRRLIDPVLYIYTANSGAIHFKAKVFSDSFSEPIVLEATVTVETGQRDIDLTEMIPNWKEILERERKLPGTITMVETK